MSTMMNRLGIFALAGFGVLSFSVSGARAQSVQAGTGSGMVGDMIPIEVTLNTEGASVASLQADITYDPTIVSTSPSNCTPNTAINKTLTFFSLLPPGCSGSDCDTVRAAVAGANVDEIPDGSLLFTCEFEALALGTSPLTVSNVTVSDPSTVESPGSGVDGEIQVAEATPTEIPPTATNTPTHTNTPEASNTPTNTPTNSPKPTGGGGDDDDGCQVVAPANSSAGWLLLIPAAALIWRRRRSR